LSAGGIVKANDSLQTKQVATSIHKIILKIMMIVFGESSLFGKRPCALISLCTSTVGDGKNAGTGCRTYSRE